MNKLAMNFFIQAFYGHVFSFLFDKYLQVEFLGHVMGYVKIYKKPSDYCKEVCNRILAILRFKVAPYPCQNLVLLFL